MGDNSESAQAWVTLVTNESYGLGALTMAHSLKDVKTTRKLVAMVSETLSNAMKDQLATVFDEVVVVDLLDSNDKGSLTLLERPELGVTFTKISCWKLTQYEKCVFLDADTLVLQNADELFDREELSAAPDVGWPDYFNSGVFVFRPSMETYESILDFAASHGSFDGGDQGLLNMYFDGWANQDIARHLPFIYNMVASATYSYRPAYKVNKSKVKIVHFLGQGKPWHLRFDSDGQPRDGAAFESALTFTHLKRWWDTFNQNIKPTMSQEAISAFASVTGRAFVPGQFEFNETSLKGLSHGSDPCSGHYSSASTHGIASASASASASVSASASASCASGGRSTSEERKTWEEGKPDYLGSASFDNILHKLESTLRTDEDPK